MPKTRDQRRDFRFSIRALLILITCLAILLGIQAGRIKRQREAVQWVIRQGGQVSYDWQFDENDRRQETGEPNGPRWLRKLVGDECFQTVLAVTLHETHVEDLTPLIPLQRLKWLHLSGNPIRDLAPLSCLPSLMRLGIGDTLVTDLSPIGDLKNLTTLYAMGTQVSDLTPLAALPKLETVNLTDTPVTEISPLAACKSLTAVLIPSGQVPDEEIAKLRESLPDCIIR